VTAIALQTAAAMPHDTFSRVDRFVNLSGSRDVIVPAFAAVVQIRIIRVRYSQIMHDDVLDRKRAGTWCVVLRRDINNVIHFFLLNVVLCQIMLCDNLDDGIVVGRVGAIASCPYLLDKLRRIRDTEHIPILV